MPGSDFNSCQDWAADRDAATQQWKSESADRRTTAWLSSPLECGFNELSQSGHANMAVFATRLSFSRLAPSRASVDIP